MKLVFDDPDFDGQLQRSVSKDNFGMANAGECLAIAAKISASDASSWYPAFAGFAKTLQNIAERAVDAPTGSAPARVTCAHANIIAMPSFMSVPISTIRSCISPTPLIERVSAPPFRCWSFQSMWWKYPSPRPH